MLLVMSGCADAKTPTTKLETNLIFSPPWLAYVDAATKASADPSLVDEVKQRNIDFQEFLWSGLDAHFDDAQDRRLREQCALAPGAENAGPLALLVAPLISLFTDQIKSSLDDELKKYAADVKASARQNFYVGSAGGDAVQTSRCFRITRMRTEVSTDGSDKTTSVSRTIDFDLVGQIAIVGPDGGIAGDGKATVAGWGIKVRALRVFLAKPISKGSEVAMAGTLAIDAVWRDGNEGKRATIFTAPILERKFKRVEGGSWMVHPELVPSLSDEGKTDKDSFPAWKKLPLQPIVPWSLQVGAGATEVTATFHATEVGEGDGKGVLKVIKKIFDKSQSDLNSTLTAAAKKLVEPSAPPATPDKYCGTFTPTTDGSGILSWQKSTTPCAAPAAS